MRIIKEFTNLKNCAVCLGNFDGLHLAHINIIKNMLDYSKKNSLLSSVLLFENHTQSICNNQNIKLLTTLDEKIMLLENLGVENIYLVKFDEAFMKKTPTEFFDFLVNNLCVKAIFVGYDYKFGYKALGNIELLKAMSSEKNIYLNVCKEFKVNNDTVSSTHIKDYIRNDNLSDANKLLGRPFFITSKVTDGKKIGRKLGFKTANLKINEEKLLLCDGVYAGYTEIDNEIYKCIINIGKNPTFDRTTTTVEAHIIDFSDDIYKKEITVWFTEKIREEIKFKTPDELSEQIKKDLEYVKSKNI